MGFWRMRWVWERYVLVPNYLVISRVFRGGWGESKDVEEREERDQEENRAEPKKERKSKD